MPEQQWPDEARFWTEINNIISEQSFRWRNKFAHDMPLTAIVLSLPAYIGGWTGVKLSIVIISSMTVPAIIYLANLLYKDQTTVIVAGSIATFYPFFIYYSGLILSETIFMFILCLFLIQLLDIANTRNKSIKLGITAGLCHLTRPTVLYFIPVTAIYLIINRAGFLKTSLFIAVFCLTVSPWIARNYLHFNTLLISTSGSGQVLWEGNNPWNNTGGVSKPDWGYIDDLPDNLDELAIDQWKKDKAFDYIMEKPGTFLDLTKKRFIRFWHLWPNDKQFQNWKYILISLISFGPVLFLAFVSPFVLKNQWRKTTILWLFIGYYTALHIITIGSIRYRLPLEPILIALASATISSLINKHFRKRAIPVA